MFSYNIKRAFIFSFYLSTRKAGRLASRHYGPLGRPRSEVGRRRVREGGKGPPGRNGDQCLHLLITMPIVLRFSRKQQASGSHFICINVILASARSMHDRAYYFLSSKPLLSESVPPKRKKRTAQSTSRPNKSDINNGMLQRPQAKCYTYTEVPIKRFQTHNEALDLASSLFFFIPDSITVHLYTFIAQPM